MKPELLKILDAYVTTKNKVYWQTFITQCQKLSMAEIPNKPELLGYFAKRDLGHLRTYALIIHTAQQHYGLFKSADEDGVEDEADDERSDTSDNSTYFLKPAAAESRLPQNDELQDHFSNMSIFNFGTPRPSAPELAIPKNNVPAFTAKPTAPTNATIPATAVPTFTAKPNAVITSKRRICEDDLDPRETTKRATIRDSDQNQTHSENTPRLG